MPTYEYKCNGGHQFETRQSIKDKPLSKCPECGRKCHRLISGSSFILKGSGWAKDGYSSGGEKKSSGGEEKSKPKE